MKKLYSIYYNLSHRFILTIILGIKNLTKSSNVSLDCRRQGWLKYLRMNIEM